MAKRTVNTLEKSLNKIISKSIFEPSSDPDDGQLETAALAYKELKRQGLKVESEDDVLSVLKGSNIYDQDFLED